MLATEDILDVLGIDLIGVVPEDDAIIVSTNQGIPAVLDEKSSAGKAYRNIALRLDGQDVPFDDLADKDGFFGRISRMVKSGGDT